MMTDTKTHTIETAYIEATIETYECDSCGNEVAYDETVEFTIGETEGRACSFCEENGPISFPRRVMEWSNPSYENYGLLFHVGFGFWILPLATVWGFAEDSHDFAEGYATAVVTILFWVGLILSLSWLATL
jgi:hypothetical protein